LSQEARTSDARLQKSQRLLIAAIRAVSRMTEKKENRQQAMNIISLLLTFSCDYNMHRRELLNTDMASEYQSVFAKNCAIPDTEFLFDDKMPDSQKGLVNLEIAKLLEKGVLQETALELDQFLSSICLTPKKDGSFRMILNEYVQYVHFKYYT
jgi:hypothetical protein